MMRRATAALATLVALTALAGCTRHDTGANDPQPAAASSASKSVPAAPIEGAPRIVNSSDGVHIEYRIYGTRDPAVILIHCWACNANYWNAQLAPLKAKYTVVTLDLAGHGASGRNRTEWSIERFGDDVAAVARELKTPRIILVGHAMGGPVALEAARRLGNRVIGIVAVDTLKTVGQPPMTEKEIQLRLKPFRENFIGHTREFFSDGVFFTATSSAPFKAKIAQDLSREPPDVGIASLESLMRMDYAPLVAPIHVPVVAIQADATGPTDDARIQKSLPTFRSVTLVHTGHFSLMEAPSRFNAVLVSEIGKLAGN